MFKFANLMKNLSNVTGRTGLIVQKHSPEILLVTGIAGTVVSAVLACRATLKVEEVLDTHHEKALKINDCWEKVKDGEISKETYSEVDFKRDLTVTYIQTGVQFVKLYGPAITLGVASIACIIGGHGIMKKRNLALVAAYKAVEEGFNAYRKRVIEEYGEQKDYMYRHGLRSEMVEETEVDENGKTVTVQKEKMVSDSPDQPSIYARFFDESCENWAKNPEYNMYFLKAQQSYFNNMLQARGHVFLNEVYDALGIPRSGAGATVGWVMRKDGKGDNYIDFGIWDGDRERARAFVNGDERSILLDFNVDGVIYDLI